MRLQRSERPGPVCAQMFSPASSYSVRPGSGAFGVGLNENVCEAYVWLCLNWIPGDEIFIFGFSRGAFTARAISGLVNQLGIIDRINLGSFQSIYDAYMKRNDKGHEEAWKNRKEGFPKAFPDVNLGRGGGDVKIKVVGVSPSLFGPQWSPLTNGCLRRFGTLS